MSDISSTLNAISTPTRISGLSGSGLDTDALVKKLMQADQIKYDQMKQNETYTEWKRDAYRDIMTKINAFTTKYFNDSLNNSDPNNLLYAGAYSVFTGTTDAATAVGTGANIIATGGAGAVEGKYHIKVDQVGTKAGVVTENPADAVLASNPNDSYGSSIPLKFKFNGTTKDIDISGLTNEDALTKIGNAFGIGITYNTSDSKYHIVSSSGGGTLEEVDGAGATVANGFFNEALGNSGQLSISSATSNSGITPVAGINSKAIDSNGNSNTVTLSFGGKTQSFNVANLTVKEALSNIGSYFGMDVTYSSLDNKYHIASSQAGAAGNGVLKQVKSTTDSTEVTTNNFLNNVFGQSKLFMGSGKDSQVTITEPSGATNATPLTQLGNNFKIDGVTYDISNAKTGDEADITMTQNVDDIYKKITGFLDDYNGLVKSITDSINQKKSYSYKPLTDDQKKSMTTDQVKQWESAGKVGILGNDSTLESMLTSLRSSFFDSVKSSGLTLNDLGLSTYGYPDVMSKAGQINYKADPSNANKLKDAIKKYGDRVGKIFANRSNSEKFYIPNNNPVKSQAEADTIAKRRATKYSEEGIFFRLNDIFQDYARPSNGYGTISRIAGTVGAANENQNNIIADQIKDQKKALDAFQTKMNEKENEYYQRFAKLEQAMSKASAQQQWLQSQLR